MAHGSGIRQKAPETNSFLRQNATLYSALNVLKSLPTVSPAVLYQTCAIWPTSVALTWGLHPLVVVGVDAHLVLLEVEGVLAGLDGAQLVVAVKVRPPPQAAVDDVRKALPVRDLLAAV